MHVGMPINRIENVIMYVMSYTYRTKRIYQIQKSTAKQKKEEVHILNV